MAMRTATKPHLEEIVSAELGAGVGPSNIRFRNKQLVVREIRRNGLTTRTDLVRATGLAKSTIKDIADDLIASGFIEDVRDLTLVGTTGRPATSLRISRSVGGVVGVDIGADKILVSVARLDGTVIASARAASQNLSGKSAIIQTVRRTVNRAIDEAGVGTDDILTTVVGTPGVIHPATGLISLAPQIVGWDGIDLQCELRLPFRALAIVRRQADLSALAEVAFGAAQGVANLLYVHIGIGIGGALVLNGHLCRGNDGTAGEIGYLPLSFGEDKPPGTGFGAFEWAAGGLAFARHGREAARGAAGRRLRELAGGDADRIDAAVVFAAATEGDRRGLDVAEELGSRIAQGIAAAVCVVNPELVVLSGGMSLAGETLLTIVDDQLSSLVPVVPKLALSLFGVESVVVGAIQHALDLTFDEIFAIT